MSFLLTGFHQISNVRQFAFRSTDAVAESFIVCADLDLIHKHRIPMQELPLLCRRLLEALSQPRKSHSLVFTEEAMLAYVRNRARAEEDASMKRKKHRVPPSNRAAESR